MNERRQGGQGRQTQRQTPREEQTPNQQVSQKEWAKQRMTEVVHMVTTQQKVIEAVMPVGVGFDRFRAVLLMLLRTNPGILECTTASIVQCCIRAAYDGVNLDGVEATAVPSNNKYKDANGRDAYRKEARYNIMVAGVRRQIMATGAVLDPPETIVVHQGDHYDEGIVDGVRVIEWRKGAMGKRGDPVGVFSMARLRSGNVSYEVMEKDDIIKLKNFATQKGKVWDGPMEMEMWRKSVLRRHKKTLLGADARPDAEEIDLFPENQANAAALPAPRARPERADYARIENRQGTEAGVEMDLGFGEADVQMARTFEQVDERARRAQADQKQAEQRQDRPSQEKKADSRGAQAGEKDQPSQGEGRQAAGKAREAQAAPLPMPEAPGEWKAWQDEVENGILTATDPVALTEYWRTHQHIVEEADPDVANFLTDAFSDKIADLASDTPAEAKAGADQGQSNQTGGE